MEISFLNEQRQESKPVKGSDRRCNSRIIGISNRQIIYVYFHFEGIEQAHCNFLFIICYCICSQSLDYQKFTSGRLGQLTVVLAKVGIL